LLASTTGGSEGASCGSSKRIRNLRSKRCGVCSSHQYHPAKLLLGIAKLKKTKENAKEILYPDWWSSRLMDGALSATSRRIAATEGSFAAINKMHTIPFSR